MLRFTKMHSIGNDFILLDGVRQPIHLTPKQVRKLANRRRGIGCDQLIIAGPGRSDTDFSMRIYNTDGSEAEHCGNGIRCFARFLHDQGLTTQKQLSVSIEDRCVFVNIEPDWAIIVEMGEPVFTPSALPFITDHESDTYQLDVAGENVQISAISLGNPHAVLLVDDVSIAPVERLGPLIERHSSFPRRINVGFVSLVSRSKIRLRVWERGVGETLGCGSGACAAVVACHRFGHVGNDTEVELPGGIVRVNWLGEGSVFLQGTAVTVYEGQIYLESI